MVAIYATAGQKNLAIYTKPLRINCVEKWQPIETAPKDGTRIFLYERYAEVPFVGWWCSFSNSGEWAPETSHLNTSGDAIIIDSFDQADITHWHPIMAMPDAT